MSEVDKHRDRVAGTFVSKTKEFEPLPLDIAILRTLPEEGSRIGKYLWDGKRVSSILKELNSEGLTSDNISGRLRLMFAHKLVSKVQMLGNTRGHGSKVGWQRTPDGEKMSRRKINGGSSNG